jgi:predicted amidophosphoribosyltransferase
MGTCKHCGDEVIPWLCSTCQKEIPLVKDACYECHLEKAHGEIRPRIERVSAIDPLPEEFKTRTLLEMGDEEEDDS